MSGRSIIDTIRRSRLMNERASDDIYNAYVALKKSEADYERAARDYTSFMKNVDIEIQRAAEEQGYNPEIRDDMEGLSRSGDMDDERWEAYDNNEAILKGVDNTLRPQYEIQRSKLGSVKDKLARIYYAAQGKFGGLVDSLTDEQKKELSNSYKDAYRKYQDDQMDNTSTPTPITDAYHQIGEYRHGR